MAKLTVRDHPTDSSIRYYHRNGSPTDIRDSAASRSIDLYRPVLTTLHGVHTRNDGYPGRYHFSRNFYTNGTRHSNSPDPTPGYTTDHVYHGSSVYRPDGGIPDDVQPVFSTKDPRRPTRLTGTTFQCVSKTSKVHYRPYHHFASTTVRDRSTTS